jgi:hypothetical protein
VAVCGIHRLAAQVGMVGSSATLCSSRVLVSWRVEKTVTGSGLQARASTDVAFSTYWW